MGRELIQMDENEWWIIETVSEYASRQSKPFVSKEEAIETLRKGGCHEKVVAELEDTGHVCSMQFGPGGVLMNGQEISKALDKMDALCPDGDHSLYWDMECSRDGCTNETVSWNGDESICWECAEEDDKKQDEENS